MPLIIADTHHPNSLLPPNSHADVLVQVDIVLPQWHPVHCYPGHVGVRWVQRRCLLSSLPLQLSPQLACSPGSELHALHCKPSKLQLVPSKGAARHFRVGPYYVQPLLQASQWSGLLRNAQPLQQLRGKGRQAKVDGQFHLATAIKGAIVLAD